MQRYYVSSDSKEELEKEINNFYYSKNYKITDDNRIYNKLKKRYLDYTKVVFDGTTWKLENPLQSDKQ